MKAYNLKQRNVKIKISESPNGILTFLNNDGMYANCLDINNRRVYIPAWTEVKLIK
jgi:hypothetical protein